MGGRKGCWLCDVWEPSRSLASCGPEAGRLTSSPDPKATRFQDTWLEAQTLQAPWSLPVLARSVRLQRQGLELGGLSP